LINHKAAKIHGWIGCRRDKDVIRLPRSTDGSGADVTSLPNFSCGKKIRDDKGYWKQVEDFISEFNDVKFSHGLCNECAHRLYPEYMDQVKNNDIAKEQHKH